MDEKIVKNYFLNLGYQLLSILLPIVTTPYVSRKLGVENIGVYSFTVAMTSYFVLLSNFSFHTYGQKKVAIVGKARDKRTSLFWEIQYRKGVLVALTCVFYLVFVLMQKEYQKIYIVQIISIVSVYFDISFFYQGLELYDITVLRNAIAKIVGVVSVFCFVRNQDDLICYVVIQVVTCFFGNLTMWIRLRRYVDFVGVKSLSLRKDLSELIELFIPVVAIQVYFSMDKIMIGMMCEKTESGIYEQAMSVFRVCQTFLTSLGAILVPGISRMLEEKKDAEIKNVIATSTRISLMLSVGMMFGILSVSDAFVPWFFGAEYSKVTILLNILSVILNFTAISNILVQGVLIPIGKYNYATIGTVCAAIVNVILNLILIRHYMAIGACVATVIAEFVVLSVDFCFSKRYVNMNVIFIYFLRYLLAGGIMFSSLWIMRKMFVTKVGAITELFILFFSGALIYVVCLLLSGDDVLRNTVVKLRMQIKDLF